MLSINGGVNPNVLVKLPIDCALVMICTSLHWYLCKNNDLVIIMSCDHGQ